MKRVFSALVLFMVCLSFVLTSCCDFKKCDHEWDNGSFINATECGEGAIIKVTCSKCGETKEESANDHNYISVKCVSPGCTNSGYTEYECLRCDKHYISDQVNALGHDYVSTKHVATTCTGMGYTGYACSRCGLECVSDFTNALGHNYDTDIVVKEATCTASGTHEKECSNCGDVYRYSSNATGHSYVLTSDDDTHSIYECENCLNTITIGNDERIEDFVENEELFDVEPSFTFDIISSSDEAFIKENLKIVIYYYNDTEFENDAKVNKNYTLTCKDNNVWTVTVSPGYEYGTTYIAKLQGGIAFADYKGDTLTFTVKNDPDHENVYEYQNGIVFLQALENANPGYYPYNIISSQESEYIYLTLNKIDALDKDMIICVGDVTGVEQIKGNTECYFGKIKEFYPLSDGTWMVVLSQPEITEVFDELDISYNEMINFDDEDIDIEQVEAEIKKALYESEDFIEFLSVVNVSANKYYSYNGYYTEELTTVKAFMDKLEITPNVKFVGNELGGSVTGTLKLPIKNKNKEEIGTFKVEFVVELTSTFELFVDYEIYEHIFLPDEIVSFEFTVTQTDVFDFEFEVSIELHVSLDENPYVQNTESGKIHRTGCVHLNSVKDTSKLKGLSAETAAQYIKDNPNLGCKHCQPVIGFKSDLIVINTNNMKIHEYGCSQLANVSDANQKLSKEKASYWIAQGYTCCQWCHADSREEIEYRAIYSETLYCSDWQQVATDMSQWAKDSGIKPGEKKGVTLLRKDFPVYGPVTATIEIRFVLTLDLEASFKYEYSYTQTNKYGMKKIDDEMRSVSSKLGSKVLKNQCTVMGKVELRAGLLVDVNINIAGFSKWVRAGVTAEVGAYAQLSGILSWSETSDENYRAAYFEVGIYLDVNLYYNILWWNDTIPVYSKEWPLLTLGYERAYFGYETYYDKIIIDGAFDIDGEDLLAVKYFDLKSMTTKTDELSWSEKNKYRVNITFGDGRYLEIINGVILPTSDAPEEFTDTLIITVESDAEWNNFKKGNYVYYLGYYEIEIETIKEQSESLFFESNGDGTCYVSSIGTCTDTDIVIPSTYKGEVVTGIGKAAFRYCTHLTSIAIPSSVTSIGYSAFYGCTSLTRVNIPNSVTSIGEYAFMDCIGLTSITIPNSVSSIGLYAFCNCSGLTSIIVVKGNSRYHSASNCLIETKNKTLILGCENSIIPDDGSVKYIGTAAFYKCSGLDNITIPDSVISIHSNAFSGCSGLTSVTIPDNVTHIGDSAFSNCSGLTSVTIPDSVTYLGNSAFYYCSGLTSVTIGNSVASIGDNAFSNCSGLTSVTIPDSVTYLGNSAFYYCSGLTSVTIGNSVASIGDNAFYKCSGLTSVTIGNSVASIGASAFYNCSGLTSITIPDSVTSIGNYAFYNCSGLTSVTIGNGVTRIERYAFSNCSGLTSVTIGNGVTRIERYAFSNCSGLTSVTIPDSVTSIGDSAFGDCSGLTSVTIGNSVTSIGASAFYNCSGLTSVTIGNSVTSIGGSAFSGCSGLTSVIIPNSVTSIGAAAFNRCSGLTSITIPDSVTSIGNYAFDYCSGLTSITIPDSVTSIGEYAFRECSGLTSITIPDSVTSIANSAFYRCKNLTNIKFDGTVLQWNLISFGNRWNDGLPATQVVCTDGVVELK